MVRLKNVRPGVVVVATTRLRFRAGEVRQVPEMIPALARAVELGLLVRIDSEAPKAEESAPDGEAEQSEGDSASSGPAQDRESLESVLAPEAFALIESESDTARLEKWLEVESRRGVKKALRTRIEELRGDAG